MLPTYLIVDDFFGFRHETLDLSTLHVGVITGRNGAGKSSIFDAIRWALYGRYRESGSDHVIRRRADRARVQLTFTARGTQWRVTREKPRGKTGTLTLERSDSDAWENVSRHTIAETQQAIEALVGLSYAALMAGPVMVQEEKRGDLMTLDPKDRKDLLIEEADVQGFESLYEQAKSEVTGAEVDIRGLTRELTEAEQLIEGEVAARAALDAAERALAARVEAQSLANDRLIAASLAVAAAEAKAMTDSALADRERIVRGAVRERQEDRVRLTAVLARHEAALAAPEPVAGDLVLPDPDALDAIRAHVREVEDARVDEARLSGEMATMLDAIKDVPEEGDVRVPCEGEGIYATCPLLTAAYWGPARKAEWRAGYETLQAQLAAVEMVVRQRDAVEADLRRLTGEADAFARQEALHDQRVIAHGLAREAAQASRDDTVEMLQRIGDELARMNAGLDVIMEERKGAAAAVEELKVAKFDLDQARTTLSSVRAAIGRTFEPDRIRAALDVERIEKAKTDAVAMRADLATAQMARETYRVLAAAFHRDGIPSMVIALLTPAIERRANEVLARLPEEMSVRLTMGEVTKSGTVSDRLDIFVRHEGEETPFGMLSGAQQFRVNLALRLGQMRTLAARSGSSVEFLLLDEADRDLDEQGVEALVETINVLAPEFGLILLISHHEWLVERVPTQIAVTRTAGQSYLAVT